jgi:hypothetical protein
MFSINNSFKRHIGRSLIHPPFSIYILPLANWVCLVNLGSTLLVFRVARRILHVLGSLDPPGTTLVTIIQVFVLPSPPGLHSGLTGSDWVAWLPHFQVSVLHGRILPVLGPQDPPGSTLVTITQLFVLPSPPGLHSGLTGSVWVAWFPHFQVSVLHGGFCPFWAPRTPQAQHWLQLPSYLSSPHPLGSILG